MKNQKFLLEIVCSEISALFDPEVRFKSEHKRNVRIVKNALLKKQGKTHLLSKPILRNSFIYGCLEFTKNEPIEHLIVGFGKRRGGGTDISSILHIIGNETSVPVPQGLVNLITSHAIKDTSSETIIFHNHPSNWLNAILPKIPLASPTDRRTMIKQKYFEPFFLLRSIFGHGTMKFYVAERKNVREIKSPYLLDLFSFIKKIKNGDF